MAIQIPALETLKINYPVSFRVASKWMQPGITDLWVVRMVYQISLLKENKEAGGQRWHDIGGSAQRGPQNRYQFIPLSSAMTGSQRLCGIRGDLGAGPPGQGQVDHPLACVRAALSSTRQILQWWSKGNALGVFMAKNTYSTILLSLKSFTIIVWTPHTMPITC